MTAFDFYRQRYFCFLLLVDIWRFINKEEGKKGGKSMIAFLTCASHYLLLTGFYEKHEKNRSGYHRNAKPNSSAL